MLSVTGVTRGPGPQTSRLHGTRCRPQTGYKLQVRGAGGRGQEAGSGPAGDPRPLPQSPQRCTGVLLLPPQHELQTPPSGAPQRLNLGRDRTLREREQVKERERDRERQKERERQRAREDLGKETYTKISVRKGHQAGRQSKQSRDRHRKTGKIDKAK